MRNRIFMAAIPLVLALGACTSTPVSDAGTSGDTLVPTDQLQTLLPGKTAYFEYGGRAVYLADRRYEYHDNSRSDRGTYSFRNNQVCVDFESGHARCDRYVKGADGYALINGQGQRYKVRIR